MHNYQPKTFREASVQHKSRMRMKANWQGISMCGMEEPAGKLTHHLDATVRVYLTSAVISSW